MGYRNASINQKHGQSQRITRVHSNEPIISRDSGLARFYRLYKRRIEDARANEEAVRQERTRFGPLLVALFMILSCLGGFWHSPKATALACHDLNIVFARGSGAPLGEENYLEWKSALEAQLANTTLSYTFYELGSAAQNGYQYPAVSISDGLGGLVNLGGAIISSGEWATFGNSVSTGVEELKAYIRNVNNACPSAKFIIGGYSQGAMVISKAIASIDSNKIVYAATFGDPKIYLPEGLVSYDGILPQAPAACRGTYYSNYRVYVPDCFAFQGVLGSYVPYQPTGYYNKLGTWCNKNDIMCSSGVSLSDHTSYTTDNLYYSAAPVIMEAVRKAFPAKTASTRPGQHAAQEVLLMLENSNAMEPLHNLYYSFAKELARGLILSGAKVGLISYSGTKEVVKLYSYFPRENFTRSAGKIISGIDGINVFFGEIDHKTGLSTIIKSAFKDFHWSKYSQKSIIYIAAPERATFSRRSASGDESEQTEQLNQLSSILNEEGGANVYVVSAEDQSLLYASMLDQIGGNFLDINNDVEDVYEQIVSRPYLNFYSSEYRGKVGEEINFAVQVTNDPTADEIDSPIFEWDLDGDNEFELSGSQAEITQIYNTQVSTDIQVRMISGGKVISSAAAHLVIGNQATEPTIYSVSATRSGNDAVVAFTSNANYVVVAVNDVIYGKVPSSSGEFTVELPDGESPTVSLIPYNSSRRGSSAQVVLDTDTLETTSATITLPAQALTQTQQQAGGSRVEASSQDPVRVAGDSLSGGSEAIIAEGYLLAAPKQPDSSELASIPKAPNTAAIDKPK